MSKRHELNGKRSTRDGGRFLALPHQVLNSAAYLTLTGSAKALLIDIAQQFANDNNGRLLCSMAYMKARGWSSNDTLTRLCRELIERGLLHQTVQGHRPNKASWFAVTWLTLDRNPQYDPGTSLTFERSAYMRWTSKKIKVLTPTIGVETPSIAPTIGVGEALSTPTIGAIGGTFGTFSTPTIGDHLDMPSTGVRIYATDTTAKNHHDHRKAAVSGLGRLLHRRLANRLEPTDRPAHSINGGGKAKPPNSRF